MGATKKHFYQEEQLTFSSLFKALGHPARITIVQMLSNQRNLNCTDLQKEIKLSLPSISRHCQVLHRCGIIGYEVIDSNCFYHLDNHLLDRITDYIDTINIERPSITGQVYYPTVRH